MFTNLSLFRLPLILLTGTGSLTAHRSACKILVGKAPALRSQPEQTVLGWSRGKTALAWLFFIEKQRLFIASNTLTIFLMFRVSFFGLFLPFLRSCTFSFLPHFLNFSFTVQYGHLINNPYCLGMHTGLFGGGRRLG